MPARSVRRSALALVVGAGLTLSVCGHASPFPRPRPHVPGATARAWAKIDRGLAELGPKVGLVAARVSSNGTCLPAHAVSPFTSRPTASQFKLFVLGALANEIAAGGSRGTRA